VRRPPIIAVVVGYFALCALGVAALAWYWDSHQRAPEQPIAFPHPTHAGKLGLECTYCHAYAAKAAHPGIPPLSLCMECHQNAATDRPGIIKLTEHWKKKEPVVWARVHVLPDHVHFTHKRHVRAGVPCTACHGEMLAAVQVRRVRELVMGFCVDCHRSRQVSIDCWVCHK